MSNSSNKKIKTISRQQKRLLFCILMLIWPILQITICYVMVNANSFILAFQEYSMSAGNLGYTIKFAGFANFKQAWGILHNCGYMIENSFNLFLVRTFVGITLALLFSFYIYKKWMLSGLFKVVLFMPQIISGLIFSLLFKYIVTDVYSSLVLKISGKQVLGLLDNTKTRMLTIIIYNVWIGFGTNVLLFSGSMSAIDCSVVEASHIDGANLLQEFVYITLPMIFETLSQFLIVGIAAIFTDQMCLISLYGMNANEVASLGYYMYKLTYSGNYIADGQTYSFSVISALGLILTVIVMPVVLGIKKLLAKYGPSDR